MPEGLSPPGFVAERTTMESLTRQSRELALERISVANPRRMLLASLALGRLAEL
jgi:hypothetical protein